MDRVQQLYDACIQAFAQCLPGVLPPQSAITDISAILEGLTPVDLGLDEAAMNEYYTAMNRSYQFKRRRTPEKAGARARWPPPITYIHIHECETVSMGIFCLPASGVIPLHDHPGMTVLTKVLYGSVQVQSYDLLPYSRQSQNCRFVPVEMKEDRVMDATTETCVLYPTERNIHSFTALTPCAILDILTPPYKKNDPSYYQLHPFLSTTNGGGQGKKRKHGKKKIRDFGEARKTKQVWMERVEQPHDLIVAGMEYTGPEIRTRQII